MSRGDGVHSRGGRWAAVGLLPVVVLWACERGGNPAAAPSQSQPAAQVYQIRGVIERLPTAESKQLMIHHEAIDNFVDNFGETVGMNAMTMPFTPVPGLDLKDLQVGDKVAFRLEVNWQANRMLITQISKLPADTKLEFRKAAPRSGPASATASAPAGQVP